MKIWRQIPVCRSWLLPLVTATPVRCNDWEIWIKALLNTKDQPCSDSSLSQSRNMVYFLRVTVTTFEYTWVWHSYQGKNKYSWEITIHPISCFSTLRQPWGKLPVRWGSTRYSGVQTWSSGQFWIQFDDLCHKPLSWVLVDHVLLSWLSPKKLQARSNLLLFWRFWKISGCYWEVMAF